MSQTTYKITTRTGNGSAFTTYEYKHAEHSVDGLFLLVTHRAAPDQPRMLSRVPLANIVQVLEQLPEKAS
jgi:hypothetical protein